MPIIHLEDGVPPSKSKILLLNGSQTGNVAAGSDMTTTLTPPKGYLWEVMDLYINIKNKAGAAAGTQDIDVIAGAVSKLFGSTDFGNDLNWSYSEWAAATAAKKPADPVAAVMALRGVVVDVNDPLRFIYYNKLDVTQTWGRSIYLTVKQTPII